MTEKEILAKIEDYMRKNNLRQYELAKKLGVPESTLNRWLKEKTNISNAYLAILKREGII
ncbi:MAG: helix-turn-helix domain-containing protein [Candidatus Omnitrophota bacterium]|nr:MAG: helix-turn-helix domain-containing protein [Candidatus Omnitrophota bacterium]